MTKVLIIGGSGFLGSHVADYFTKKKYCYGEKRNGNYR